MKLTAFEYGKTELPEKMAFEDGCREKMLPISLIFFLLETGNRKILIDVGCDTMPGFTLFEHRKPAELLEEYGINCREITDVLLTHAHHDHIDAVRYYTNADVYIQEDEAISAECHLKNIKKLHTFTGQVQIADKVVMKCIGGHSKGSCIVLISQGTKSYVLCGDECYTMENLMLKKPTGTAFCPEKSLSFINEYSKNCYTPLVFHDPELVGKMGIRKIF